MILFSPYTVHVMTDSRLHYYEGYMTAILDRNAEVAHDGTDVRENIVHLRAEIAKRGLDKERGYRQGWEKDVPEVEATWEDTE